VARDATKAEIKEAVEKLFKVTVEGVSTVNVKPKVKRTMRGHLPAASTGRRPTFAWPPARKSTSW
jgi:large subunit ribosomal protein L23